MSERIQHDTVIFDVDGTLVDSTYQHALAWARAFQRHDVAVEVWRVHRAIGMGSDKLVAAIAGDDVEARLGDALRDAESEEFAKLADEVAPLPGARELIERLQQRFRVAVGSSGQPDDVQESLEKVGVDVDSLAAVTTSGDVDASKPSPEILETALRKAGGSSAIVIGDAVYDVAAAARMGAPCIGVRTGGFSAGELEAAGAVLVVDDLTELLEADWDALAQQTPPAGAGDDPAAGLL